MTVFILAAAALALAALILLLRPWRRRLVGADFTQSLNAAIHRDRLAELDNDRAAGTLSDTDYAEAGEELRQQLLEDTAAANTTATGSGSGRATTIALALALPLAAVLLYLWLGSPNAMLSSAEQSHKAALGMEELIVKLEKKLQETPDNMEGWAMLARSYKSLGRLDDAERTFNKLGPTLENNATLLAEFADLLAAKANGSFAGRPHELLQQALRVNPDDMMTLWLAGTEAFEGGRYSEAIKHWERLALQLEPGSEDASAIAEGIAKARERGGKSAAKVGAGGTAKDKIAASDKAISGRLELAPALRAKAKPDDVVFVFARAEGGPPMPLAALRLKVSELPHSFTLGDANALGGAKVSEAKAIRVEARVAKSGTPTASPGDLTGRSDVVKPGAKNLRILIDTEAR